jgi:hypothetical protein
MRQSDNMFYSLIIDHERLRGVLFSLFAICILTISVAYFALSMSKPCIGLVLYMNDRGWVVESVDPNGLAIKAGIMVGDRPIEINNQPSEIFLEKYTKVSVVFGMLIKDLTVINDSGQLKSVTLEGSSQSWESMIELITLFVFSLIFWIIGFYIFLKRPRNGAALLLWLFNLLLLPL